jgi:hypothetical protein
LVCGLLACTSGVHAAELQSANGQAADEREITGRTTSSSGITTEVKTETAGELSQEDLRQASLLGAHLMMTIEDARVALDAAEEAQAKDAMRQGLKLVEILRTILPETTQTTRVKDKDGKLLFEDSRQIEADRIPLYAALTKVNFLEPVVEAKKEAADVAGMKLADTEFLQTTVTLDLSFVERRINDALRAQDLEQADSALARAQSEGLDFSLRREDQPLAEVRDALWYAQRAAATGNYVSARANLGTARQRLTIYRDLMAVDQQAKVVELAGQIEKLEEEIEETAPDTREDVVARIKGMFDQVASWFAKSPGEVKAVPGPTSAETTAKSPDVE